MSAATKSSPPCDRAALKKLLIDIIDREPDSLGKLTMKTSLAEAERDLGLSQGTLYIQNRAWSDEVLYEILAEKLEQDPALVENLDKKAKEKAGDDNKGEPAKPTRAPRGSKKIEEAAMKELTPEYQAFLKRNRAKALAKNPLAAKDTGILVKTVKGMWDEASAEEKAAARKDAARKPRGKAAAAAGKAQEAAAAAAAAKDGKKDDDGTGAGKKRDRAGKAKGDDKDGADGEPAAKKAKAGPPKGKAPVDFYVSQAAVKERLQKELDTKVYMKIRSAGKKEYDALPAAEKARFEELSKKDREAKA